MAVDRRLKDVILEWNEPRAIGFIGRNVKTEHLMYCLEIDPPLDGCQDQPLKEVSFHADRCFSTVVFLNGSMHCNDEFHKKKIVLDSRNSPVHKEQENLQA